MQHLPTGRVTERTLFDNFVALRNMLAIPNSEIRNIHFTEAM